MNAQAKLSLKPRSNLSFGSNATPGSQAPKVLIVVMDGVGISLGANLTRELEKNTGLLPDEPFRTGNAVGAAFTPNLAKLCQGPLYRTLKAHGPSVGLPSADDMGNSEVGHNAMGSGRVFDQGSKLVGAAIATGALFKSEGWHRTVVRKSLKDGTSTLHMCGLLSDGNVHSHINHLFALIAAAKQEGVRQVRLHTLLDGRDVGPLSALQYTDALSDFLATQNDSTFNCLVASGGGRMNVTMDRYESDWRIVERGYKAHVLGAAPFSFPSLRAAVETLRKGDAVLDQDLPPFVITHEGKPLGPVADGDSFLFFNFRGDRALEITRALTEENFSAFERGRWPRVHFAGMMQYDGDLLLPQVYLVNPPTIENTMGELLANTFVPQFACSETQKYGHVTYFWNGNRSGKFNPDLEHYLEIPSDLVPFAERPWMKSAEITDATIMAMRQNTFHVGRINFPNGDMVGHTGDFAATVAAMGALDLCLGRLMAAARETNTILIVTADHGNADEMFERDKKSGHAALDKHGNPKQKTSHTLSPVPFALYNAEALGQGSVTLRADLPAAGLANIAATTLELAGFEPPDLYEPSLIAWNSQQSPSLQDTTSDTSVEKRAEKSLKTSAETAAQGHIAPTPGSPYVLAQAALAFHATIARLRAPTGCPWDREQTFASLRPYMIEEAYEAVVAASKATDGKPESAAEFCDELGDVLLQVFLNAQIAAEGGLFDATRVFTSINEKMIRRHPHVFTETAPEVHSAADVVTQWDQIKSREGKSQAASASLLAKAFKKRDLPTLTYGTEVSKRAAKVGFAWNTLAGTFADIESEVQELKAEVFKTHPDWDKVGDEFGDVVYAMCNLVTFFNADLPETEAFDTDLLVRAGIEKFVTRFKEMETIMSERGMPLTNASALQLSLNDWNQLWAEAKSRRYR